MSSNALKYKIEVIDKASRELKQIAKEMGILDGESQKVNPSLKKTGFQLMKFAKGGVIGVAAIAGIREIKRTFDDLTKAYAVQEQAQTQLSSALKASGITAKGALPDLENYASQLQKITLYGDETTLSADSLLVSIGGLDDKGVKQIIPRVQDFATALNLDLNTAASLVAKTINSSTNALTRYGVQVDMSGSKSDKLAQLTDILNKKFGGMARAAGDTATGSLIKMNNATGDLKEQMGRAAIDGMQPYIKGITNIVQGVTNWLEKQNEIKEAIDAVNDGTADSKQKAIALNQEYINQIKNLNILRQAQGLNGKFGGVNDAIINRQKKYLEQLTIEIARKQRSLALDEQGNKYKSEQARKQVQIDKISRDAASRLNALLEARKTPQEKQIEMLQKEIDKWAKLRSQYKDNIAIQKLENELVKERNELQKKNNELQKKSISLNSDSNFITNKDAAKRAQNDLMSKTSLYQPSYSYSGSSGFDFSGLMSTLGNVGGIIMKIVSKSSDFVKIIQLFNDKLTKVITDALSPIFNVITNFLTPVFEILGNIIKSLTPVFLIVANIFKALGDLLLVILPRLGVIIQLVGNMLTPILKMLIPLIKIFTGIMKILNPVIAFLAKVMDALSRPVQFLGDLLSWLGKWLIYFGKVVAAVIHNILHPFRKKKHAGDSPGEFHSDAFTRKLINMDDFSSTGDNWGSNTVTNKDIAGAGASYTAGRSTTVNVVINTDVITGDNGIRELALMIRNEINSAVALGY